MRGSWYVWIAFLACLAVVLVAMGWISVVALRLDRAEAEARWQAVLEENVRLSLWRIDTALTPLRAQESARPYFSYHPFLPVDRAYSNMFNDRGGGEMLIPSPLLSERVPNILVHFQFEPDGELTSPQVPTGTRLELAVPYHISKAEVEKRRSCLDQVASLVSRERLAAMLPESAPTPVAMVFSPLAPTPQQIVAQRQRRNDLQQQGRGAIEYEQRYQAMQQSANFMVANAGQNQFNDLSLPSTDVRGVLMTPLWVDGQLILARRITASGEEYVQGCLIDWPAIKESLLVAIEDLLPDADLEPVAAPPAERDAHMVAAIPVRLIPGAANVAPVEGLSPVELSLALAWGGILLAAVAVAGLVMGIIRLSERRATFVSAVTHELRTPLTTFQMYAEMLAEGMVPDEQRASYLKTLQTEAARLTHLVENVLAYARLERGRNGGQVEHVTMAELVDRVQRRLSDRAKQAGMELVVEDDADAGNTRVATNISAVEQVLLNLVDNACKYAAEADDKRIHLAVEPNGKLGQLSLRDHGPGVSETVRRRLFHSFSKSAHEAAHSAPGVGLGLALSRRLARDMGGDLRLDESNGDGARFVLTLAVAE